MFYALFLAALLIGGVITMLASRKKDRGAFARSLTMKIGAGITILAVVLTAFAVTTIVKPREIGVKVALGKPIAPLANGFHFKAPWETVEILDGAVQTDKYTGEHAINVRLRNNSTATVNATVEWILKSDDAMAVFLDYKTFAKIQSNLVDRNFDSLLNEVLGSYDPLNATVETDSGKERAVLAAEVEKRMQQAVGTRIEIRSVTIPLINFDGPTQDRINELQSETAKTRVAQQKKQTSTAEAEANKILEASVTAETLTSKCLDIVAESKLSPIGCFPGGTGVQPITMVGDAQK